MLEVVDAEGDRHRQQQHDQESPTRDTCRFEPIAESRVMRSRVKAALQVRREQSPDAGAPPRYSAVTFASKTSSPPSILNTP